MKNLQKMDQKEFKEFLQESMTDCSGIDIGLACTFRIDGNTYPVDVILTNYMIYEAWKTTSDYKYVEESYSKETIDEYEEMLYKSHLDTINNRSVYLDFHGDDDFEAINEDLIDFYNREEQDIDFNTLYDARDDIQEELEERIDD